MLLRLPGLCGWWCGSGGGEWDLPQRQSRLPVLKNGFVIPVKPLQDLLLGELGDMASDIIIESDQALLHGLQDDNGGEDFGGGGEQEFRVRSDAFACRGAVAGCAGRVGVCPGACRGEEGLVISVRGLAYEGREGEGREGGPSALVAQTTACGILSSLTPWARTFSSWPIFTFSSALPSCIVSEMMFKQFESFW